MNIEEFYTVIRRDTDPVDFSTIKQDSTGRYYSESENCNVDYGTAYYINVFKKHGNKDFFWSWNWAALLASTTFAFYRKLYILWGLKWAVLLISTLLIDFVISTTSVSFNVVLYITYGVQKIFFATVADSLYIKKISKMFNKDKQYRLRPSTAAGVCGLLLIPGLF